jgi:hypothetical protein
MKATKEKSGRTVRITVKVRPDEYDKFISHVRDIDSNLSAFFRESAAKAMKGGPADLAPHSSIRHETGAHVDVIVGCSMSEKNLGHQRRWAPK